MDSPDELTSRMLNEMQREIEALKRELYSDERSRHKGLLERVENLENHYHEFRGLYEREKQEVGYFEALDAKLGQLELKYSLGLVYLKGIVGTTGAILAAAIIAAVVGLLRWLAGS